MNKADLVSTIATEAGITKQKATIALDSILTAVVKEEKVVLAGFGTFLKKKRAAKVGRNPSTGESIKIPAKGRGKKAIGENHGCAKLTGVEVKEIRQSNGLSRRELAKQYNVSKSTIDHIIHNQAWTHV